MKNIVLDLREAEMAKAIIGGAVFETDADSIIVRGSYLREGTYEVALLLACAGFQRFVHEVFLEAAKEILRLKDQEVEKYKRTDVFKKGNPNSTNIKGMFNTIGIFDLFREQSLSGLEERLNEYIRRRNDITHGAAAASFHCEETTPPLPEHFPLEAKRTEEGLEQIFVFFQTLATALMDVVQVKVAHRAS